MTKNNAKTTVAGHSVRILEKETDIDPLSSLGKIEPIKAHGITIIPTPMASNLESILWVSTANFMKIKAQIGKK